MPEDLLREAGIRGVSLEKVAELRTRALAVVEREVARRRYDRDRDVRNRPEWQEDKPVLVVAGESGQGKTWQLARLALDLAHEGDGDNVLSAFLVSQGNATGDLQQAADLLWKQAWGRDTAKSLDRVADHWREIHKHPGQPWLAVCVLGNPETLENGSKRSGRDVASVPWNDRRSILLRVVPDLMASLALAFHLAAEATEMTGQLSVGQAGTRTGTRPGAVTVSMPGGRGWLVSTMTAIRS